MLFKKKIKKIIWNSNESSIKYKLNLKRWKGEKVLGKKKKTCLNSSKFVSTCIQVETIISKITAVKLYKEYIKNRCAIYERGHMLQLHFAYRR